MAKPVKESVEQVRHDAAPDADRAVRQFLSTQENLEVLRFIVCGSVDDGKSTLVGRLLWDADQIFDDQVAALKADSAKHGSRGDEINFALLVDGLAAEREQGMTIDVGYRFFATDQRRFIAADVPGDEQYTRNMITGATTADVAVIVIDARQGVMTQTRRHAYLASLTGVKHVVLAVNKMDLVDFDEGVYQEIADRFSAFATEIGLVSVTAIPVSGILGDNITRRSASTAWYAGPTLLGYLETVPVGRAVSDKLVFPVQSVSRADSDFRGFAGTIAEGELAVGDSIRVTGSGEVASVSRLVTFDGDVLGAGEGRAITVVLDKDIDASRGDVLSSVDSPIETSDQFEATIVWLAEDAGLAGRSYDMKVAGQWAAVSVNTIKHHVNVNTMAHEARPTLELNDIAVCTLSTSRPVAFDKYADSKTLGGFILVDRLTHETVAAGMILHSLRRASNVHKQASMVTRQDREKLNGHSGKVIWFTGLSGSGKSTIANQLEIALNADGRRTYILDGDNVRLGLNKDLGFTDADRVENIRRIAEVARLMLDCGIIVMTAFISPFERERQMARELIGEENFVEVFVDTPLAVCEGRDVKGLYKKARAGQLPNMTGIGSPYEEPESPSIVVNTVDVELEAVVERIHSYLFTS